MSTAGDGSGPRPVVSVILPTYQRRELVRRAVASVLAQTYRDFELIVIDDGSSDGTREALADVDERLRYQRQPNRGVAAARNAGLRLARGSIVAFLDSDDRWLPEHLAVVTEVLASHPGAVLVTTCPSHVFAGRAAPKDSYALESLPSQFFANPVGYNSCLAVRRNAVTAAGGFDERLIVGEGWELWLRLAFRGEFRALRRQTTIVEHNRGLKDWGRRRGDFLDAFEFGIGRTIAALGTSPREQQLKTKAEGSLRFVTALRSLDRGDDRAVEAALHEGCRLCPELCREPENVERRLGHLTLAHEPPVRLRHLATAASLWPDPRCDTALFLRACATLAALRLGRTGQATRMVAGWPLRPTPGFLKRTLPAFGRRARRGLTSHLNRGQDNVDLDAALEARA